MSAHWRSGGLDRRVIPRAEYRRTPPALLEFDGFRCAVRDIGIGGLRVEPAPPGKVWDLNLPVVGEIHLRATGRHPISGRIVRIDKSGLAVAPDGSAWPSEDDIVTERALLQQGSRERRVAPRLPVPVSFDATSPLRDVSVSGIRYQVAPFERPPAVGDAVSGELRVDAETIIEIRGRVIRRMGQEVAIAIDPPGLPADTVERLRRRFFPGLATS
jgi:hypothetical protein